MSAEEERAAVIERIADIAEAFAEQACVGGMETAGMIVSYLSEHPDWIGAFMKGGVFALPADWIENGRLTCQAVNGKAVHPEVARQARVIKKMERDAHLSALDQEGVLMEPEDQFANEAAELFRKQIEQFARWLEGNWRMTEKDNDASEPKMSMDMMEGWNRALASVPDALNLYLDGEL